MRMQATRRIPSPEAVGAARPSPQLSPDGRGSQKQFVCSQGNALGSFWISPRQGSDIPACGQSSHFWICETLRAPLDAQLFSPAGKFVEALHKYRQPAQQANEMLVNVDIIEKVVTDDPTLRQEIVT